MFIKVENEEETRMAVIRQVQDMFEIELAMVDSDIVGIHYEFTEHNAHKFAEKWVNIALTQ